MATLNDLTDLLHHTLGDVLYAERRIERTLPRLKEQAQAPELAQAFDSHHRETTEQIKRLEAVFDSLGAQPKAVKCEAILGLLEETEELARDAAPGETRDAALVSAAQAIEHYEIARYGTLRDWAERLGHTEAARLLGETLEEEKRADDGLTKIAQSGINRAAA